MTVTNSISIIGSGIGSTRIVCDGTAFDFIPSTSNLFRISSIAFSNGGSGGAVSVRGLHSGGGGSTKALFRIDHCLFQLSPHAAIYLLGYNEGVIDHSTFLNCEIAIRPHGDESFSWSRPITPGTTNCVVIEDNRFEIDNNAASEPDFCLYHQSGSRTTIRHNVFDGSAYTLANSIWFDSHGNQSSVASDPSTWMDIRGQPLIEMYANTFISHHTYRFAEWRGGMILCYSNAWSVLSGSAPNPLLLWEEEAWQTAFFNPVRTVYPAIDQITNSFFWANTRNGTNLLNVTFHDASVETNFIQLGRDYWLSDPRTTQTTNGSGAVNLFAGYVPLVYPHPLVASQTKRTIYVNHLKVNKVK